MKKIIFYIGFLLVTRVAFSQDIDKIITQAEVERIEKILASDEMEGRKTFTPSIDRAATFIASEFGNNGLRFFQQSGDYRQPFQLAKAKLLKQLGTFDGQKIDSSNILALTTMPELAVDNTSGYEMVKLTRGSNLLREVVKLLQANKNYVVIVDTSFSLNFSRLARFSRGSFKKNTSVIFVLSATTPVKYAFIVKNDIVESPLANVIGVLPGKSKKNEVVVFSAHYDHLGIGKPDDKNDSIYNGANDDAAGITAILLLSKYFKQINNNERTLIFVAFTAEEIGGFGSKYFSQNIDPASVIAMFNIEMIGTGSKWGTNSAYITGFERSNFGKILQANLRTSKYHFEADPYPQQNLFFRSDNATLASMGVPAHTISTAKMDAEKYYHKQGDEVSTLDLKNMTEIIKAIAVSSTSIVNGKDTPIRIPEEK